MKILNSFTFRGRLIVWLGVGFGLVAAGFVFTSKGQDADHKRAVDLRSPQWTDAERTALNKLTKTDVASFVYRVVADGKQSQIKDTIESIGPNDFLVGDYTFMDLNADGNLELIASVDTTGRPFYNTVVVVAKIGGGLVYDTIISWNPTQRHDFNGEFQDLAGAGKLVLIAKSRPTGQLL